MVLTSKSHRCIGSRAPAVALRAVAGAANATSMAASGTAPGAGPGCSSTGVGMSVVKMPRGSTFTRTPASIRMRQSSCAMASWQSVNGAPGSEASPTSWPYASHIVCRREPHGIERPVYGRTRRLSHPM